MSLLRRVLKLDEMVPKRTGRVVPTDRDEFLAAFVTGKIKAEDIDLANPDHISWLTYLAAVIGANSTPQ